MSLFGGITDWLTGGSNQQAEQALNDALAAYTSIQAPTQQQLSLPELQNYVNAGLMTPAQAQAYLQNSNAFATENIPQTGTAAMQSALGQLQSISDAGPMGTPVEQAQIAQNIQQMNNAVQGQRGAIEQNMEAKGTPAALIQAALENQYVGQDASQAYQNSLAAQAAAYQAQVQAMSEAANVGGALQGMQNTQANTVANAQNAMEQFNAQNQQQASALNSQLQQQANQYNTTNAQNVANQNTGMQNARTAYNTSQAQTAFEDAMNRANAIAGVGEKQAGQYMQQGQENAGTAAGIFGGLSNLGQSYMTSNALNNSGVGANGVSEGYQSGIGQISGPANLAQYAPAAVSTAAAFAKGGIVGNHEGCYHDGGICMADGGVLDMPTSQDMGVASPEDQARMQAGLPTKAKEALMAQAQARASGYVPSAELARLQASASGPTNQQMAQMQRAALGYAHGGMVDLHAGCYHDGGICMEGGGMVPGHAKVAGDSLKNDHVHALLSPGEAVIPRTAVQTHMPEIMGLISHGGNVPHGTMPHMPAPGSTPTHPHDVATVLQALKEIRMGVPGAA